MSSFVDPIKKIKENIKLLQKVNKAVKKAVKNKPKKRIVLKSSVNVEDKKPRKKKSI